MSKQKRARATSRANLRPLQSEVMAARTAADVVIRRAVAEPDFRRRLAKDPARTLRSAGVPVVAIEDVSRELVIDGRTLAGDCTETCMMTCLITCFITGKGRLPADDRINPA
jgi:hypothetical protein